MRYLHLIVLFCFITLTANGQSLTISENSATSGFSSNQFLVAGHTVDVSNGIPSTSSMALSGDVNALTALSGILSQEGVTILSGNQSALVTTEYSPDDDSSLKLYVKANGAFILRENIANFLFYGSDGKINQSVSNSSQSKDGESISKLAADPAYKTVVLYNPKIVRGGNEGSRAQLVKRNGTTSNIWYSENRIIRFVKVSDNGQFVAIVSSESGSNGEVTITDRFGNEVNTLPFDQDVVDVNFTNLGRYIVIRSNGRVAVHSLVDGNRVGSTSFRSMLHFATYLPEENTIIALTGDQLGNSINDVEIHAVDISARSIERRSYQGNLGKTDILPVQLTRRSANNYVLTGFSKILNIRIN